MKRERAHARERERERSVRACVRVSMCMCACARLREYRVCARLRQCASSFLRSESRFGHLDKATTCGCRCGCAQRITGHDTSVTARDRRFSFSFSCGAVAAYTQVGVAGDESLKWELGHPRRETCAACMLRNFKEGGPPLAGCGSYQASASASRLCSALCSVSGCMWCRAHGA
jgi:hypothetical protein